MNDTELNINDFNLGEEFDDAMENNLRLPEGQYLAVVKDVELKFKESTGSVGWLWQLAINANNETLESWDTTAKTVGKGYYTYLGKRVAGQMVYGDSGPGFGAINMLKALNQKTGKLDAADVKGRQLLVNVVHEPDWQETKAGVPEEDATKVLSVKSVRAFAQDGVKAPRLPGYEKLAVAEYKPSDDEEIAF